MSLFLEFGVLVEGDVWFFLLAVAHDVAPFISQSITMRFGDGQVSGCRRKDVFDGRVDAVYNGFASEGRAVVGNMPILAQPQAPEVAQIPLELGIGISIQCQSELVMADVLV